MLTFLTVCAQPNPIGDWPDLALKAESLDKHLPIQLLKYVSPIVYNNYV